MGGYGSGRPVWYTKADTVEDCRVLDANRWMREKILRPGVHWEGGWKWWDARTGEETSSLRYEVNTTDSAFPWVRLSYTLTRAGEHVDYKVPLVATRPHWGGIRWWFFCPLVVNGIPCTHRVGKLYLPPGGRYYGCRHCYRLTYTSCQESHKHEHLLVLLARAERVLKGKHV